MISYLKCCLIAAIILIIYKLFNDNNDDDNSSKFSSDGETWHKSGNKFYKIN